jgi:phosphoribosylaminoimidazolecarboxamide formyltransferase / IMP cyclohydrolase
VNKTIHSALLSVYSKDGLEPIVRHMHRLGITMYSTGGTQTFIEALGLPVIPVENITGYPSILGGRVKTLHPGVFGGILQRRDHATDQQEVTTHNIPAIDCVVVDLYPFEDTVAKGASHEDIIEKIDIGGISLIRAAAKNYNDVVIVPGQQHYAPLLEMLEQANGVATLEQRRQLACAAFDTSSHYDSAIFRYFAGENTSSLKISEQHMDVLRYGENPHQKGVFYGHLSGLFDKLNGKELSYNNLLDVDAAVNLIDEFKDDAPTFAILKHNNACGIATRPNVREAYLSALACDPVSAFGGVLISNATITMEAAQKIHDLFCEVVIAPDFETEALALLSTKPNRIVLHRKPLSLPKKQVRSALHGLLVQDKDLKTETIADLRPVTPHTSSPAQLDDLIFANKVAKHTKSNTIVIAKNLQLCAAGTGQTSRVDALNQAIEKARAFNISTDNAVMASDAFFPFPDCVEIASKAGITAVVQPGGSIKDQLSIDFCASHGMAMYLTGTRHFRH